MICDRRTWPANAVVILLLTANACVSCEEARAPGASTPAPAPVVVIDPPAPTSVDALQAVVVGAEEEERYSYRWHRDDVPYDTEGDGDPSTGAAQVHPRHTTKGEEWTVYTWRTPDAASRAGQATLRLQGDAASGEPEGSATVTIANFPRTCDAAAIAQGYADGAHTFTCQCTDGEEADGEDEIRDACLFYVDGVAAAASATVAHCALPAETVPRGAQLRCDLYPADLESVGDTISTAPYAVTNLAPGPAQVSLSPAAGAISDTFSCDIDAAAVDPDGDPLLYHYRWIINDFLDPRFRAPTVVAGLLARDAGGGAPRDGDRISCEVVADDGFGEGAPARSASAALVAVPCQTTADCFFGHPCLEASCGAGTCAYREPAGQCPSLSELFGEFFYSMDLAGSLAGDTFEVQGDGVLDLPPFGLVQVSGSVTRQAGGPVTWCFSSQRAIDLQLSLLRLEDATVTLCRAPDGSFDGDVSGTMVLETIATPITADLVPGRAWQLDIAALDLDFLGVRFDRFAVATGAGRQDLSIEGRFTLGEPDHGPRLVATGRYVPQQDFRLDLALAPGAPWRPLPSFPALVLPDIDGAFRRVAGMITVDLGRDWEGELAVTDAYRLTGARVEGHYGSAEPWRVSLGGTTAVEPFPDPVELLGDYDAATGLLCLRGSASVASDRGPQPLGAELCFHLGGVDDPTIATLQFSAALAYAPPLPDRVVVQLRGAYQDQVLCLTGDSGWTPPGGLFTSPVTAGLCLDFHQEPPALSEVDLRARVRVDPLGEQWLHGSYDADAQLLCLSDTVRGAFGVDALQGLSAEACFDVPGYNLSSSRGIRFSADLDVPAIGTRRLTGSYSDDVLCLSPAADTLDGWGYFDAPVTLAACYDFPAQRFEVEFYSELYLPFLGANLPIGGAYTPYDHPDAAGVEGRICLQNSPAYALALGPVSGSLSALEVCLALKGGALTLEAARLSGAITDNALIGAVTLSGAYVAGGELCLAGEVREPAVVERWFGSFDSWLEPRALGVESCFVDSAFEALSLSLFMEVGSAEQRRGPEAVTLLATARLESESIDLAIVTPPGCRPASGGDCLWQAQGCDAAQVACEQTWQPFSRSPWDELRGLSFSDLSGSLSDDVEGTSITAAGAAQTPQLQIGGLVELKDIFARVKLTPKDKGFELGGSFNVDRPALMAAVDFEVAARVDEQEGLVFRGRAEDDAGFHLFDGSALAELDQVIDFKVIELDFELQPGDLAIEAGITILDADLSIPIPAGGGPALEPLSLSAPEVTVGMADSGSGDTFFFDAAIEGVDIPLGPDLSIPLKADDTHRPPRVILANGLFVMPEGDGPGGGYSKLPRFNTVEPGLSIYASAHCPIPLGSDGSEPSGTFIFNIDLAQETMDIAADLEFEWELIRPEYNMPGVQTLATEALEFLATVSDVSEFGFGGVVAFVPDNPFHPVPEQQALKGEMLLLVDTEGHFGGEISLQGLWYEPFFMPDFAVMNPALMLKIMINPDPPAPIPVALGLNGDLFWLKPEQNHSWPPPCPSGGPDDGTCISTSVPNANVPLQLLHAGGTIYFDSIVVPSGFAGVPLPPVIVRLDFDNFDGLRDFTGVTNSVKNGVLSLFDWTALNLVDAIGGPENAAKLERVLPAAGDGDLQAPATVDGYDLQISKADYYFSTHNLSMFGVNFSAGFLADLDATFTSPHKPEGEHVALRAALDASGASMSGRLGAFDLASGVTIAGDPLRKRFDLAGGVITIADDDRLDLAVGTIEGWVEQSTWEDTDAFGHTVVRHQRAATDGYRVDLGDPEQVCALDGTYRLSCENFGSAAYPCGAADPAANPDYQVIQQTLAGDGGPSGVARDFVACAEACGGVAGAAATCVDACVAGQAQTLALLSASCAACYRQRLSCDTRARVRVRVGDASGARTVTTTRGEIAAGALTHVAVTFGADERIHVYVDGRAVPVDDDNAPPACAHLCTATDCSTACDGGACDTVEACLAQQRPGYDPEACSACQTAARRYHPITPAPSPAAVELGGNLEKLDDVRLWNTVRTAVEIQHNMQRLPVGYFADSALVARYEADFDALSPAAAGVAHNSRLYPGDASAQMHGAYDTVTAEVELYPVNDLAFGFNLPAPAAMLFGQSQAGFWFHAGVVLSIPQLRWSSLVMAEADLSPGAAKGMFYDTGSDAGMDLIAIPQVGTFVLGGAGPNGNPGDFDDGLYGYVDLLSAPAPSVQASASFVWRPISGASTTVGEASLEHYCPSEACSNEAEYKVDIGGILDDLRIGLPPLGDIEIKNALVELKTDNDLCWCDGADTAPFTCGKCADGVPPADEACGPAAIAQCVADDVRFTAASGDISVDGRSYPTRTDLTIDKSRLAWDSVVDLNLDGYRYGDFTAELSVEWAGQRFCAEGSWDFPGNASMPPFTRTFSRSCLTSSDILDMLGIESNGFCVDDAMCGEQFCHLGVCLDKYADGATCLRAASCASGACSGWCYQPHSKNLGEACVIADECASGSCFGVCTCAADADCVSALGTGHQCAGAGSAAACVLALHGADCSADAGICPAGYSSCADGGHDTLQCLAADHTLFAGSPCRADRECSSGYCADDTASTPGICNCRPGISGDCPAGAACIGKVGDIAACLPTLEGTRCYADRDCDSGQGQTCRSVNFSGVKQCLSVGATKVQGQACFADDQCEAGACYGTVLIDVQGTPGTCNCSGDYFSSIGCPGNEWCWENGVADLCLPHVCRGDHDCPSGQYCYSGGCFDKAGNGAVCTANHVCRSNDCARECHRKKVLWWHTTVCSVLDYCQ